MVRHGRRRESARGVARPPPEGEFQKRETRGNPRASRRSPVLLFFLPLKMSEEQSDSPPRVVPATAAAAVPDRLGDFNVDPHLWGPNRDIFPAIANFGAAYSIVRWFMSGHSPEGRRAIDTCRAVVPLLEARQETLCKLAGLEAGLKQFLDAHEEFVTARVAALERVADPDPSMAAANKIISDGYRVKFDSVIEKHLVKARAELDFLRDELAIAEATLRERIGPLAHLVEPLKDVLPDDFFHDHRHKQQPPPSS